MDPRHAEDIGAAAPRGVVRHYDGDHFQIYHPPLLGCAARRSNDFLAGAFGCPSRLKRCGTTTPGSPSWLADISAAQWAKPSLCSEWTNHEVLAHLVIGYGAAVSAVAASMLRHRGSFDAANTDLARRLAAQRDPAQLIDDFIALARRPRGIGRIFPRRAAAG